MTDEPRYGEVIAATSRWLTVRFDGAPCSRCAQGTGCGSLTGRSVYRHSTVQVPNSAGLSRGDRVKLRINQRETKRSLLCFFVWPTGALVASAALTAPWLGDIAAALVGLGACVATLFGVTRMSAPDQHVDVIPFKAPSP
ncbi:MAG: SoxR reducing system RseC family protein [Pseudomonadota bacterium]